MAIVALFNFALVLFDYSYVPWRDFYLQIPTLTQFYDPVKGIEPHPITENYLEHFNTLKEVSTKGLDTPLIKEELSELRTISDRLIEDNPFAAIGKSSNAEKIKHDLSVRTKQNTARDAFATFWSQAYLNEAGWQSEINFFDSEIKPLIATNYYRDLDRFGKFVDYFWLIDLPFVIIFALDILIRTYFTSRRIPHLSWWEAILRRWYDLFLVLLKARLLRIIPVTVRLYQANLLNLKPLRKQLNYGFILGFIEEIAELLGIQVIDRLQESIKTGSVAHRLFHPERRSYIELNLFGSKKEDLAFLWSKERCVRKFDYTRYVSYYIKDLKKVKRRGYALEKMIMVDNSPEKLYRQYGNLMRVLPFEGLLPDDELLHL